MTQTFTRLSMRVHSTDINSAELNYIVLFSTSAEQVAIQIEYCVQNKIQFKIQVVTTSITDEIECISEYFAVIVDYIDDDSVVVHAYNQDMSTVI